MTLENVYHLVASVGVVFATCINFVLWRRGRPDKVKESVETALQPIKARLDAADKDRESLREAQRLAAATTKAAEHEIDANLREVQRVLDTQTQQLARIETKVNHMEDHDQAPTLHHRVTECAKQVSSLASACEAQAKQLALIHTHLLQVKRDG